MEVNEMEKEYKQIEGNFIIGNFIIKDGQFLINNRKLEDYDKVHLKIVTLKKIIADAKIGVI